MAEWRPGRNDELRAMEWLKTVRIRIFNLPGFVGLLHYQAQITQASGYKFSMIAHVRHNHTNYENLLACMEDMNLDEERTAIYLELRTRINEMIETKLNQLYGHEWQQKILHR